MEHYAGIDVSLAIEQDQTDDPLRCQSVLTMAH